MILWWQNDTARAFESFSGFKRKIRGLIPWGGAFSWWAKTPSYIAVISGCIYFILHSDDATHTTEYVFDSFLIRF